MAKTFRTVGSGSAQTIEPIENNKIPVYDTITDAEADLTNLTVNQIIATKDEGSEVSSPVDVVEDGNMHAVTSNAVADACTKYPDYSKQITIASGVTSWVATVDCYVLINQILTSSPGTITIDGNDVGVVDLASGYNIIHFSGYVKKGQTITFDYLSNKLTRIFELTD